MSSDMMETEFFYKKKIMFNVLDVYEYYYINNNNNNISIIIVISFY